ncbi:MAG: hypothetical protein SFW35_09840 [Chitinophagales bacterium]|nr:hypothetical protein [Chitinophagales bacterium]
MSIRIVRRTPSDIRVGHYGESTVAPPIPDSPWIADTVRGPYQELRGVEVAEAQYVGPTGLSIRLLAMPTWASDIVDTTLNLVPTAHLEWFNLRKPQGIRFSNSAGTARWERHTGGLNPSVDYSSSADFNERQGILITYGALWEFQHLGICPTILHEIGHVMTHAGKISYNSFSEARAAQLGGTRVSRNSGSLEALCNAYMYFLCYGSLDDTIHAFGDRSSDPQRDRVTRDGLRACPAFGRMINSAWRLRFEERD